jgi:hypothetical protein
MTRVQRAARYVQNIRRSGLSIYDPITVGDPNLWIPTPELERILDNGLRGRRLAGLPLRTRSKLVKQEVCRALGYPVPSSFKRTRPRFPGQLFDTYVQKSDNLQVWNEELAATRRYVLVRVSDNDVITRVKVVTGDRLAALDSTGTLTQKYQARCVVGSEMYELVTSEDTAWLRPFVSLKADVASVATPLAPPRAGELLPIAAIFGRLQTLVGSRFPDAGRDQDRNRGTTLHRRVCRALGYVAYEDDGRFPDIRHQLIEVKLQTAPTIDLGLVRPDSTEPLDVPSISGRQVRHCDVRYAIFCGHTSQGAVSLTHLILTTGERFFDRFPQFKGRVLNRKLQIPLPAGFFDL